MAPLYIIAMYTASHGEDPKSCKRRKKTVHLSLPSFCILPWWISHQSLAESSDIHSLYRQSPLEILVESRGYRLIFMRSDFFSRHDSFPARSMALWFIGPMLESGNSRFTVSWTRFFSLHQPATKNQTPIANFLAEVLCCIIAIRKKKGPDCLFSFQIVTTKNIQWYLVFYNPGWSNKRKEKNHKNWCKRCTINFHVLV